MSKFNYALRQRVIVPGVVETQGVVTARSESIAGPNQYFAEWLSPAGQRMSGWFDEGELLAVNGGPVPAEPAALVRNLKNAVERLADKVPAKKPARKVAKKKKR